MADESAGTILKILNGVQSGVDVALLDGTYTLGSGDDDDIQIFDVSLRVGHAKLRIGRGKIEIAGASGALRTRNGAVLEAGGEFGEVEQLDVVSAGTTRFALGARTANWASITDEDRDAGVAAREPILPAKAKSVSLPWWRSWHSALPAAAVLLLAVGGLTVYPFLGDSRQNSAEAVSGSELDSVRGAVAVFDFGRSLKVEQEVDGAIFVTGFVDTPVQRRAIVGAVKELNIPVRVRVAVRDVIRDDVASLIEAGGYKVSFELSDAGSLTLSGVVLDPKEADSLVGLMRDRVIGLTGIESKIRTAPILLGEAKTLAGRSQIEPLVLLRLDGNDLIEASGVVPTEKIDAWVGFLQAYSNQFADTIPLRSLVRLQNPDGSIGEPGALPGTPLYLGNKDDLGTKEGVAKEDVVDVDLLRSGKFALSDIFVNKKPSDPRPDAQGDGGGTGSRRDADGKGAAEGKSGGLDLAGFLTSLTKGADTGARPATTVGEAEEGRAGAGLANAAEAKGETAPGLHPAKVRMVGEAGMWTPSPVEQVATDNVSSSEAAQATSSGGAQAATAGSDKAKEAALWAPMASPNSAKLTPVAAEAAPDTDGGDRLGSMARELLGRWSDNSLGDSEAGRRLAQGMAALDKRRDTAGGLSPRALADRYAVLLARGRTDAALGDSCWPGSHLTKRTVSDALFWLDLFSVSETLSTRDLSTELQNIVLEAALNPRQTTACAISATGRTVDSVYLYEVARNRDFVGFITRDLDAFPLDVAGVNLSGERFVQTRKGLKMTVGYAPDQTSRVAMVGELGVVVERSDGYSTSIFGPDLNWVTQ